jgi:hypothetical protein
MITGLVERPDGPLQPAQYFFRPVIACNASRLSGAVPQGRSTIHYQEMTMKKTAMVLALAMGLAGAQVGAAFANPPDEREVWEMLKKSSMLRADGMVTKSDFVKLMEKRFDAMDKGSKGMLSPAEIAKLLDPNIANP